MAEMQQVSKNEADWLYIQILRHSDKDFAVEI